MFTAIRSCLVLACLGLVGCGGGSAQQPDVAVAPDLVSAIDVPDLVEVDAASEVDAQSALDASSEIDQGLRLNHLQAKGTHNSYHVAPSMPAVPAWSLTMAPLSEQLGSLGVRQFELDLHYQPDGGLQVYHVPTVDDQSTCRRFADCLVQLRSWSMQNPLHHLLFVMMEPKDDVDFFTLEGRYDEIEAAIRAEFPPDALLIPDDVRQGAATLQEAVRGRGWPGIEATRGKTLFVLLDEGMHRDAYTAGTPSLEGRLMFVTSSPDRDDAAIFKLDDPIAQRGQIEAAVSEGFIVRTRADSELEFGDGSQLRAALESGAHLVSTDFPGRYPGYDYVVEIPDGTPSRCNPRSAPSGCTSAAIETLP
jgi:hypothetical protein